VINMTKKIRKHCRVCRHPQRDEFEVAINAISYTPDDLDQKMDWPSGSTSRHMRNHVSEYDEKSNPKCKLCTNPMRDIFEKGLAEGSLSSKALSETLETTREQIALHMKSHLQPLVQKSAATFIATKEVDEISVLSKNIQRLDSKLDEILGEALDHRVIDSLTKLAREVRESLKYLMEFKGKLIHRRQDTIIVAQLQIVKEVLAQQHPNVWLDVKKQMEKKLQ
jgi:hypothetical protein